MDDSRQETDRLRRLGQTEFEAHEAEYDRLRNVADMIMSSMEYHKNQMASWNLYLGELATPAPLAQVIPIQRGPDNSPAA